MATLIKIDKNGSKHYSDIVPCDRCGGVGSSEAWAFTGFTCYKCGGTGRMEATWIERTPEYEAKLEARRKARAEKRAKENAEILEQIKQKQEQRKAEQEAEEARIKALKAISQYVGEIGEKISANVTFDHTAYYDFKIGWREERMHIHTFKDDAGNVLVWKTTSNSLYDCEEGQRYTLTGTVKEHSEYRDEKQTLLTRCKVK